MKKIIVFILMISFVFTGCAEKDNKVTLIDKSALISNNNQNSFIAEDEAFIYYYSILDVYKMSKKDNVSTDIYTVKGRENALISSIEYFDNRLYITIKNDIISMDTNGENELKADLSPINDKSNENYADTLPRFYTYNNELYLVSGYSDTPYNIDTHNLSFKAENKDILKKRILSDGTVFTKKNENEGARLYIKLPEKDKTLFSKEDENILLNSINYTDKYVFYLSNKAVNPNIYSLYRVDILSSDRKLIKEADAAIGFIGPFYDSEYIYLTTDNELFKINKETLKEENMPNVLQRGAGIFYEPSNEKLFFFIGETTCFDTQTGEEIKR